MTEPTHVTYTQAISWLAFADFDHLSQNLSADTLTPWQIESPQQKICLLKGLKLIQKKKSFTENEWNETASYETHTATSSSWYGIRLSKTLDFVKKSGKSLEELISDLSVEIDKEDKFEKAIKEAQALLLEKFRSSEIEMFGRKDNTSIYAVVPAEIYLSDDLDFWVTENCMFSKEYGEFLLRGGERWSGLKVKRMELIKLSESSVGKAKSKAEIKKPKILKKDLLVFLKEQSTEVPIPTRDEHLQRARDHFNDYRVPRPMVDAARKTIWGQISPGPRKEAEG